MVTSQTPEGAFLRLCGAVLNGVQPEPLPQAIPMEEIAAIARKQEMFPLFFCAVNAMYPDRSSGWWDAAKKEFLDDCMRSEIQMEEFGSLCQYLCDSAVKLIPLKGCVLKELYPSPFLRVMRDVDFLYEGVAPKKLAELMTARGYSTESLERKFHDVFHKKPVMNIEAHRKLVTDDSPYQSCFANIWSRALPDTNIPGLYHLRPEDLYLHVIVHAAGHLLSGGIGVRPIADIYVLNRKYRETWDETWLDNALRSAGLSRFEEKMRRTAEIFFGVESQDISDEEMGFFFRGGAYGVSDGTSWSYYAQGGQGKLSFLLGKVFRPLRSMREEYPILKRWPAFLPFMWVYHCFYVLFHRPGRIADIASTRISGEGQAYTEKILKAFGLKS